MKGLVFLRLVRIGFLPLMVASNVSMVAAWGTLQSANVWSSAVVCLLASNIGLMLYGSLLNDFCDRPIDAVNQAARKVFAEKTVGVKKQRTFVLIAFGLPLAIDLGLFLWLLSVSQFRAILFLVCSFFCVALATAYSLPPIRARARLLGATWTLMTFYPLCFLRIGLISNLPNTFFWFKSYTWIICGFLWATHGITTVALKDIPDFFSDRSGNIRSVPNRFGPRASTFITLVFILLTFSISFSAWFSSYLSGRFFLILVPMLLFYIWLSTHLESWFRQALSDAKYLSKSPRMFFHAVAYLGTWGVLIPAFMYCLHHL